MSEISSDTSQTRGASRRPAANTAGPSRPHQHRRRPEWVPRTSPTVASSTALSSPLLDLPSYPNPNPIPNTSPFYRPRPPPCAADDRPPPPLIDRRVNRSQNSSTRTRARAAVPPPASSGGRDDANVPQLVQEIQDKLARGTVECMICYDMIRRSAPVWSCSSCYSIFHLPCIKKWARSPTSAADPRSSADTATADASWRCPGCQSVQSISARDISYNCFCGRRRDPPDDLYLTPHSCGEPCGKPLDRGKNDAETIDDDRCPHVCVLQCHPGPCPPCKAFAPRRPCPCGKKTIVRRCSDKQTPITCGRTCGRKLSCGRHRCERLCHTGACSPCRTLVTAACFCSKKTEVVFCGDMAIRGDIDEFNGVFSCNEVCGRLLACGNHWCGDCCHPGLCGECELLPQKVKTCHCGKTELSDERKSCLDPIPTCSMICDKLLTCGTHHCLGRCHEGDCAPCLVLVSQKCRCGSSSRTIECYKAEQEKDKFVCEKPCGRKKNCGRHRCSERCCPLSKPGASFMDGDWDPHLCSLPCGKRLRCGQHSCQLLCHSGHCPPCLETIFSELTCSCGRTSIPPPIPCGTPVPSCPHQCLVPQPCGHNATHNCHFGDCPPCSVPVPKECIGGHVLLRNIPCGSKEIRCNQLCGKTRQCGIHACARTCHPPPCDSQTTGATSVTGSGVRSTCGQVCGAPRRECRHTCTAPCHPSSPCPDLRCDFPVTISCSCGRITASVPCSAGGNSAGFHIDTLFESSFIQKLPVPLQPVDQNGGKKVPLGQRKLTCNEDCAKLERKRVLAEAFDITPPNLDALHFGENSAASQVVSDLFRRDPKWVIAVEERFKFLVMGKSKGSFGSGLRVHVFGHMTKDKRDALRLMAERWKLSVQAAGWEPKRFAVVHVTPKSKPPARILDGKSGLPANALMPLAFDPLIDMDPRLVVAMLDLPRDADVSTLVLRFGGECELVWLNDKNALAVFSDPARAATALRRLDHGSTYQGAVVTNANSGGSVPPGGNAWGRSSNPWKKSPAPDVSSVGKEWPLREDAMAPTWGESDAPPIFTSTNPWNVLDHNNNTASSEVATEHDAVPFAVAESSSGKADTVSSSAGVAATGETEATEEAADDWEDVYE